MVSVLLLFIGVCIVLALAIVGWGVSVYNSLVAARNLVRNAWAQIDVQLKRRYDLIPNLVETVKGYASHESETLENVIKARNTAIAADGVAEQAGAENMLTGALNKLFALSESYPNLKANENFAQLQEELTSTENKIAFSRQHYNSSVGIYNVAIQKFPANTVAGMFNFAKREFFELDDAEQREAPSVKF